tara:strand:- start:10855 stop:11526 length:672 start_codon:yes stop_codon:yes gene_type:complete
MLKSIIIDFDNTIGYFRQMIYLLNIIEKTFNRKINETDIEMLIDIYPYILRPKIIDILKIILDMKSKYIIKFFILYTKNKNKIFVNMIINYLAKKINCNSEELFDFKIFTDTKKSFSSLLNDTNNTLFTTPKLCIIDDKNYTNQLDNTNFKIYYIKCDSYKYFYNKYELKKCAINLKIKQILLNKYIEEIYKIKKLKDNLPIKIHNFNSSYIIKLLTEFCLIA